MLKAILTLEVKIENQTCIPVHGKLVCTFSKIDSPRCYLKIFFSFCCLFLFFQLYITSNWKKKHFSSFLLIFTPWLKYNDQLASFLSWLTKSSCFVFLRVGILTVIEVNVLVKLNQPTFNVKILVAIFCQAIVSEIWNSFEIKSGFYVADCITLSGC